MRHVDIVDDENRKPAACKADYNCNQTLRYFGFLHIHPMEFWIIFKEETRFDLDTVRDTLTEHTVMIIKGVVVKQQCIRTE